MANEMIAIQTTTLTGTQGSIVLSNIPQTYDDLLLRVSIRGTQSGTYDDLDITFNGESARQWRGLYNVSGTIGSNTNTAFNIVGGANGTGTTSNTFTNIEIYIPNYTSSNVKMMLSHANIPSNSASSYSIGTHANTVTNGTAITSITLTPFIGSLVSGSTANLYGISYAKGDTGAKATGGVITTTGSYTVHTFTTSGTFVPSTNLTNVEYLVVGGGGAGWQAGGGGGGYRCSVVGESSGRNSSAEARISMTSGVKYSILVGAGGYAAQTANNATSGIFNGSNSSIIGSGLTTITSLGGGGAAGWNNGPVGWNGGSGGSGGGGYSSWTDSGSGGAGTAGQGFDGGGSNAIYGDGGGGGGGGAGGSGTNASGSSNRTGGTGGVGLASSINGTSTFRAGGGGGTGNAGCGAHGNGSGVNTGGGGQPYTNGDSGIVIIRYLT